MNDTQIITAPFNVEQVRRLNSYQIEGRFHPYTCADCDARLIADVDGWHCEHACGYRQDWAHRFSLYLTLDILPVEFR